MSDDFNIENLFKDSFSEHQENPSDAVWEGVDKKLNKGRLQNLYKNTFKDYRVNPSAGLWKKIAMVLFIKQFFSFKPGSFNVYYFAGIILTSLAVYFGIQSNASQDNELIAQTEKIEPNKETSKCKSIDLGKELETESNAINKVHTRTENAIGQKNSIKQVSVNDIRTKTDIKVKSNIEFSKDNAVNNLKQKKEAVEIIEKKKEEANVHVSETEKPKKAIVGFNKENSTKQEIAVSSNINALEEESRMADFSDSDIDKNEVLDQEETHESVIPTNFEENIKTVLLDVNIMDNGGSKNLVSEYRNIENNETTSPALEEKVTKVEKMPYYNDSKPESSTVIDTVGRDAYGNVITYDFAQWSAQLIYGEGLFGKPNFEFSNTSEYKDADFKIWHLHVGGLLSYAKKDWSLQSGLLYSKISEKASLLTSTLDITETEGYSYFEETTTVFDTLAYMLDTDALIGGDTVWIPVVDSSLQVVQDSIYSVTNDTSITNKEFNPESSYTYLEIPIIYSFRHQKGNITYLLSAGMITGIYLKSIGQTIVKTESGKILQNTNDLGLPYVKTSFTFCSSFGIEYDFDTNLSMVTEAYYRRSLTSLYDNSYSADKKFIFAGIRFGIKYKFKIKK